MIHPGGNAPLPNASLCLSVSTPTGADIDLTLLQIKGTKVRGDGDMCFYGQPEIANGAVKLDPRTNTITLDVTRIDPDIDKIVITATLDGDLTFGDTRGSFTLTGNAAALDIPVEGRSERALILSEVYRHKGGWKIKNIGQGFNGGLKALAEHFGVDVADEDEAAPLSKREKRLVSLEKSDPGLVSLVKKVGVSLAKKGGVPGQAKVCLCLDISGSMSKMYRTGQIDTLVKRILALGLSFDDDGDIDVFLFGRNVHEYGTVNAQTYQNFSANVLNRFSLEGGTRYGDAMERIQDFYKDITDMPVFVMFVTDGGTDDKPKTKKMLTQSASKNFFWKMMGIIPGNSYAKKRAGFLQELDDLPGRAIDNCDFFNVTDPSDPDDAGFFDNVMEEYPDWLKQAQAHNILPKS